jgi:hypothetical protein
MSLNNYKVCKSMDDNLRRELSKVIDFKIFHYIDLNIIFDTPYSASLYRATYNQIRTYKF